MVQVMRYDSLNQASRKGALESRHVCCFLKTKKCGHARLKKEEKGSLCTGGKIC